VRCINVQRTPDARFATRCARAALQCDCEPNSRKLAKREEQVIAGHMTEPDLRVFAPILRAVRDMVDKSLTERNAGQVGQNWPNNSFNCITDLRIRLTRD
jgi:hypothetical protein